MSNSFHFASLIPTEPLAIFFVVILLFIFLVAFSFSCFYKVNSWTKINNYLQIIPDKIDGTNIHDVNANAEAKNTELWADFSKTLVEMKDDNDHIQYYRTLDADYFFNTTTLSRGISESRIASAVPGFLTAIGLLGTFVGLQMGLAGIDISSGASIDAMRNGISKMIDGASVAFVTSIWGVALSFIYNVIEKSSDRKVRIHINILKNKINGLFRIISPEKQLLKIANDGEESRDTLKALADKIGDRMQESTEQMGRSMQESAVQMVKGMQESIEQMGQGMQAALEKSLDSIMGPAIHSAQNSGAQAIESLVSNFMDKFGEQGKEQRIAMDNASDKMMNTLGGLETSLTKFVSQLDNNQSMSAMRENNLANSYENKVNKLFTGTSQLHESTDVLLKQVKSLVEDQVKTIAVLLSQSEKLQKGIDTSSKATLDAAHTMHKSSELVSQSSNRLSNTVDAANDTIQAQAENNLSAANQIKLISDQLLEVGKTLNDAQTKLNLTLDKGSKLFDGMTTQQEEYFSAMKDNQTQLLEALEDNTKNALISLQKCIGEYAIEVQSQTNERMSAWNLQTSAYTEKMTAAVDALSGAIDGIEDALNSAKRGNR